MLRVSWLVVLLESAAVSSVIVRARAVAKSTCESPLTPDPAEMASAIAQKARWGMHFLVGDCTNSTKTLASG
jgi:hypothetical protein